MDAVEPEKEYLNIRELWKLTGRSVSSLRRDVRNGMLEAFQPAGPGGKLLFRRDAIERCQIGTGTAAPAPSPSPAHLPGRRPKWMAGPPSTNDPH